MSQDEVYEVIKKLQPCNSKDIADALNINPPTRITTFLVKLYRNKRVSRKINHRKKLYIYWIDDKFMAGVKDV